MMRGLPCGTPPHPPPPSPPAYNTREQRLHESTLWLGAWPARRISSHWLLFSIIIRVRAPGQSYGNRQGFLKFQRDWERDWTGLALHAFFENSRFVRGFLRKTRRDWDGIGRDWRNAASPARLQNGVLHEASIKNTRDWQRRGAGLGGLAVVWRGVPPSLQVRGALTSSPRLTELDQLCRLSLHQCTHHVRLSLLAQRLV